MLLTLLVLLHTADAADHPEPEPAAVAARERGLDFQRGRGVPRDDALAAVWFAEGCALADARSCALLGEQYLYGFAVHADVFKGAELTDRGCELGDRDACKQMRVVGTELLRCRNGKRSACGEAWAHFSWGYVVQDKHYVDGSLSYVAEAQIAGHKCTEYHDRYLCRRVEEIERYGTDQSATPAWMSVDGEHNASLPLRHCLASNDEIACDSVAGMSMAAPTLEQRIAAEKLCTDHQSPYACKQHTAWTTGTGGDGLGKALGAALSVAGQVAGSQASALAEGGHMAAAYAGVAAGAVLPQLGRSMQGGEDASWVAGTAMALSELSNAVRTGQSDPYERAMGGSVSLVPAAPAQIPTPAAVPTGPLCVPPDIDSLCQAAYASERNACDGIERGFDRDSEGTVVGGHHAEYLACFRRWENHVGACNKDRMASWRAANPQCGTSSGGTGSTIER